MRAVREALLTLMVAHGFSQAEIASILDPDGYEEDRDAAMLRIRKQLARLREDQPEVYAAGLRDLSPEGLAARNLSDEYKELQAALDPNGTHVLDKIPEE
jgi:DNA-directed RNA polymerase specialized sigma54-like protein